MNHHLTVRFEIYEGELPDGPTIWQTPKIGVLQTLELAFMVGGQKDGRWHVFGGQDGRDDSPIWHGYGDHMDAAVLDWLAGRLGLRASSS